MKGCPARVSQRAENYLKTNFTFTRVSQHNYAIYQLFISSAGVTTYEMRFNAFKELGSKLANLSPRLANVCSPLFYCEGLSRQLRLINRLCWITEGCLPAASGSGLHGTSDAAIGGHLTLREVERCT